jgi:methyl-accepting chemotaxis protein/hemerythrin
MALLKRTKMYSVGVKTMDGQHIALVESLSELHAAMLKGQAQNAAGALIPKLMNDANTHFPVEERLMEATKFPGLIVDKQYTAWMNNRNIH